MHACSAGWRQYGWWTLIERHAFTLSVAVSVAAAGGACTPMPLMQLQTLFPLAV